MSDTEFYSSFPAACALHASSIIQNSAVLRAQEGDDTRQRQTFAELRYALFRLSELVAEAESAHSAAVAALAHTKAA